MSSSQVDRELHSGGDAGGGHRAVSITSEVLVVAIVFFFVAVVVVFFLHIYTKMRWYRRASNTVGNARAAHSAHGADGDPSAILQKGLDPDVIRSLPILVLQRSDLKEGSECAVCLSEFADSEKARLLPNCNHRFHLDCIDVWFRSHSTCPLCRSPVGPQSASNSCAGGAGPSTPVEAVSTESLNLPTNVLFWGTQDQISTGGGSPPQATGGMQDSPSSSSSPPASGDSKGVLVIDIPRRAVEELTSSEERKSPEGAATGTPGSTRLRSFRRLLTRVRASGGDIEQGAVEVLVE